MSTRVMLFADSVPSEWVLYTSAYNKFLRGASSGGGTGGSSTHTHTFSAGSATSGNSSVVGGGGSLSDRAVGYHTHSVNAVSGIVSGSESNNPPYITAKPVYYDELFDEA